MSMLRFLFIAGLVFCSTADTNADAPYIVPRSKQNIDTLKAASKIAMSGIQAQNERMKVVSQNIANIDVTGATPEADTYRRKIVFFENKIDPQTGAEIVAVKKIQNDNSDFILKYQPNHPAADKNGYVKYPNVNIHIELGDGNEAKRGVSLNANSMDMIKSMQFTILNMMKN